MKDSLIFSAKTTVFIGSIVADLSGTLWCFSNGHPAAGSILASVGIFVYIAVIHRAFS